MFISKLFERKSFKIFLIIILKDALWIFVIHSYHATVMQRFSINTVKVKIVKY